MIEHANHLADAAKLYADAVDAHTLAVQHNEEQDTPESALAVDDAVEALTERHRALRSAIHDHQLLALAGGSAQAKPESEATQSRSSKQAVTPELAALAWQRAVTDGNDAGDMSLRVARHVAALLGAKAEPVSTADRLPDDSDTHINELVRQRGYSHPVAIAARMEQWIGRYGGQDSGTLVMGEAMRALRKLTAEPSGNAATDYAMESALAELVDKIVPNLDTRRPGG